MYSTIKNSSFNFFVKTQAKIIRISLNLKINYFFKFVDLTTYVTSVKVTSMFQKQRLLNRKLLIFKLVIIATCCVTILFNHSTKNSCFHYITFVKKTIKCSHFCRTYYGIVCSTENMSGQKLTMACLFIPPTDLIRKQGLPRNPRFTCVGK